MAKTYIDTVKYVIYADYEVDGIVEKPDIVGAIFGQTEGLLGEGLDLRELQKGGRIGRIEVTTKNENGKTSGIIEIPSSLDRVDTSVLAAGVEAVDRVGPCEARLKITKIDDTRTNKRQNVISRAQEILKNMISDKGPDSKEISDTVREETKTAEVISYGSEQIAAGPEAETASEIIIVEGRADVISLLKAGIKNVISLHGKNIPPTVVELVKNKEVTIFIDGDRGGDLIIKQIAPLVQIAYITKAPDGKEVEELTQKEILKCLKKRMSYGEYMKSLYSGPSYERRSYERKPYGGIRTYERRPYSREGRPYERRGYGERPARGRSFERSYEPRQEYVRKENPFEKEIREIEGSLSAVFVNNNNEKMPPVEVKNMRKAIEDSKDISRVIFDGVITQGLVELAQSKGVKDIVGIKKGKVKENEGINVYTLY